MAGDSYDKMEDDNGELKPHCFGHHFHWSEGFFFLLTLAGIFFALDGMIKFTGIDPNDKTFCLALGITFVACSAIACSLVWNLISIKRVAACAEMMAKEVETLRKENERARNMQQEKRKQDEQMKAQLANLEKAELLLKGSVTGLEDVKAQQEDMMKDRLELLESRRELADKLQTDMKDLWKATIEQAREELTDRAELYFKHADKDGDGIEVGGEEWDALEALMNENGITLNSAAAGEDGVMDSTEFSQWLDSTLRYHFNELSTAVKECEEYIEKITSMKIELMS